MTAITRRRPAADPLAAMIADVRRLPSVPLPEDLREEMIAHSGMDLSAVRVHRTPQAARYAEALGANAFTFDRDVVVGPRADADSLRHEAIHAVQFARHGAPAVPRGVADSGHRAAEAEAGSSRPAAAGTPGASAGVASPGGMIQRQETSEKKKAPTTLSGDLYRMGMSTKAASWAYSLVPPDIKLAVQVGAASNAFIEAFLATAIESLSVADAKALKDEFSSPAASLQYMAGVVGGIPTGIVLDLYSNLEGLYEIAKLAVEFSPAGLANKAMKEIAGYAANPDLYVETKRKEGEHAKQVISAVTAFFKEMSSNPTLLIEHGEEMGAACGEMVSQWFHGDFLKQPSLRKGFTVGKGVGMAATEIALLFLGPEEWVLRGAVAVGKVAKGSRIYRSVVKLLEKVPEMARLVKVKNELDEANKILKAAKNVEKTAEAASEARKAEKAVAAAGDVPKGTPPKTPELPKTKTKPAKVQEPVKPVEPVKAADPVKVKEPAEVTEPVKPAEPAKVTEPVKPAEPAKLTEPVKPAEPAKVMDPIKSAEPAQAAAPKKSGKQPKAPQPLSAKPDGKAPKSTGSKKKAAPAGASAGTTPATKPTAPKTKPPKAAKPTAPKKGSPAQPPTKGKAKPATKAKAGKGTAKGAEAGAPLPKSIRDRLPAHISPEHEKRLARLLDQAEDAGIYIEGQQLDELLKRLAATPDAAALDKEFAALESSLDRAKEIRGMLGEGERAGRGGAKSGADGAEKLPEGTQASGTTTKPRTAELTDAEMLAENLSKTVGKRPPGHEAHHIVPKGMKDAEEAREILRDAGIGINDAENGIWLPKDPTVPNVGTSEIHSKVHTKRAISFMTEELRKGAQEGPEGVRRALRTIREQLSDLRFER